MRHVLVIDDSTVIRKIVRRVLEAMDVEIIEASDVRQALAVCSLSMPDAIFVDASMPTLDGLRIPQETEAYTWRRPDQRPLFA